MTIDIDYLEALAKAATPGPWVNTDGYKIDVVSTGAHCASAWASAWERYPYEPNAEITSEKAQANAAYIAAANPQTVLELISELRKAVNIIRKEREARNWLATMLGEYGKEDGSAQEWLDEAKRIAGIVEERK